VPAKSRPFRTILAFVAGKRLNAVNCFLLPRMAAGRSAAADGPTPDALDTVPADSGVETTAEVAPADAGVEGSSGSARGG
jgi:hypothetical protein